MSYESLMVSKKKIPTGDEERQKRKAYSKKKINKIWKAVREAKRNKRTT